MNQKDKVINYLKKFKTINTIEGHSIYILRLSERIRENEARGYKIDHNMIKYGDSRIAEYTLIN